MSRPSNRRSRSCLAVMLLALQVSACHSWQVRSLYQQGRREQPETLRLLLSNGQQVIVSDAILREDSLIGQSPDAARVSIPRRAILDIASRQLDVPITAALVTGGVVAAVALTAVLSAGTCGAGPTPSC